MLYDHSTDPHENINLSKNQEYENLVNSLGIKLKEKRGAGFLKNE